MIQYLLFFTTYESIANHRHISKKIRFIRQSNNNNNYWSIMMDSILDDNFLICFIFSSDECRYSHI